MTLIIMFNNKSNTYLKQNNNSLDRFETIMFKMVTILLKLIS